MSLFIVGTPIGNLKDISFRALETLKEADLIIAESPRQTLKIFSHFGLPKKKIIGYRRINDDRILKFISKNNAALVSSSGMPGISDPGQSLVSRCREKGIEIKVVPGPTALASAVSLSGMVSKGFCFLGFLSKTRGEKIKIFKEFLGKKEPIVFYESPYRIIKTLEIIEEIFPQTDVFIAKELTKIFENCFQGKPKEIIGKLTQEKNLLKGEFTVIAKTPVDKLNFML